MIYIFYGVEPFVAERQIHSIVSKVQFPDFDLLRTENVFNEDVYQFLIQYPLMGNARVALLSLDELISLDGNKYFEKYLAHPSKISDLIIKCKKVDERNSIYKKLSKDERVTFHKCEKLSGKMLQSSILRHIKQCGAEITKDAYELFLHKVNYAEMEDINMYHLINELNKLINYDEHITVDSVNKVVRENLKENIFSLTTMLFNGNLNGCYRQIEVLLSNKQSSIGILALVQREFRIAYKAAALNIGKKELNVWRLPVKISENTAISCLRILDEAILEDKNSSDSFTLLKVTFEKLHVKMKEQEAY